MEIKEIHFNIKDIGDHGTIRLFTELFYAYINKRRTMNDTAIGDDVLKNQGAIDVLKELINMLISKTKDTK
jgi:hypothetical protein